MSVGKTHDVETLSVPFVSLLRKKIVTQRCEYTHKYVKYKTGSHSPWRQMIKYFKNREVMEGYSVWFVSGLKVKEKMEINRVKL